MRKRWESGFLMFFLPFGITMKACFSQFSRDPRHNVSAKGALVIILVWEYGEKALRQFMCQQKVKQDADRSFVFFPWSIGCHPPRWRGYSKTTRSNADMSMGLWSDCVLHVNGGHSKTIRNNYEKIFFSIFESPASQRIGQGRSCHYFGMRIPWENYEKIHVLAKRQAKCES